jgi:predicted metal-dependent hydrolase
VKIVEYKYDINCFIYNVTGLETGMNIKIDQLIRTKRKSITLEVTAEAKLVVRAPLKTPLVYLERLIEKKTSWILSKQKMAEKQKAVNNKPLDNDQLLYLGNSCKFDSYDEQDIKKWYTEHAMKVIKERVDCYSRTTGIYCKSVKISNARRRWGSCGPKGSLNFTWRLVMAPIEVIDYVVVHELAHILVRNHSKVFWAKVRAIMPDYEERRKWLRENRYLAEIL